MLSSVIATSHRTISVSELVFSMVRHRREGHVNKLLVNLQKSKSCYVRYINYCSGYTFSLALSSPFHSVRNQRKVEAKRFHNCTQCKQISAYKSSNLPIIVGVNHQSPLANFQVVRNLYAGCSFSTDLFNAENQAPLFTTAKRFKKNRKKDDYSDDSDEEDDVDDYMFDEESFEEDYFAPTDYKQMKLYVKSHRLDSIISAGLNISRKKIDELFYASKLRLNDEKVLKKSVKMKEGDCIDVIMDTKDESYKVKRVRLMKTFDIWTDKERTPVILRSWRSSFDVPRTDHWKARDDVKEE